MDDTAIVIESGFPIPDEPLPKPKTIKQQIREAFKRMLPGQSFQANQSQLRTARKLSDELKIKIRFAQIEDEMALNGAGQLRPWKRFRVWLIKKGPGKESISQP